MKSERDAKQKNYATNFPSTAMRSENIEEKVAHKKNTTFNTCNAVSDRTTTTKMKQVKATTTTKKRVCECTVWR